MEVDVGLLIRKDLTPNEYFFLYFLVTKKMYSSKLPIDLQKLERNKYIKIGDQTFPRQNAINLFETSDSKSIDALVKNVDNWIDEWRELWPSVRSHPYLEYSLQGSRSGCIKNMKSFIKTHKTSKEDIFKATRIYISEKANIRFEYTVMANYFIIKNGHSLLEMYLERIDESGRVVNTAMRTNTIDL